MNDAIEHIVIVGGGTAGWLSAAYLSARLGGNPARRCRITLVESADIGTIGVGEATIPTLRGTLRACGIDEAAWMAACNATFKVGIKFVN